MFPPASTNSRVSALWRDRCPITGEKEMGMYYYTRAALTLAAASLLWAPAVVRAQDANRDAVITSATAEDIVNRLENKTGAFKSSFNKALDDSTMDGSRLEDRSKRRADDLHDNASKLKDEFHDKRDKNNPKVRDWVDKTLAAGADVNRIMTSHRFTDKLQEEWNSVRADLNGLAALYRLSPI
jgi:hypothetical protein